MTIKQPRGSAHKKVKTAKGRKTSSTRWLGRQLNDPYVEEAKRLGYKSRAAFKLQEIQQKFDLVQRGDNVIDLGAAPGGWCQIALESGARKVIGLDLLEIDPITGVEFLQMDFMAEDAPQALKEIMGGPVDCVISDMAPNTSGHKKTDHIRIMSLVESAAYFAMEVLKPGGHFVAKVFQGGAESELLKELKMSFHTTRHFKPKSSRKESSETYLIALDYKDKG